jgi:hypothetical protein
MRPASQQPIRTQCRCNLGDRRLEIEQVSHPLHDAKQMWGSNAMQLQGDVPRPLEPAFDDASPAVEFDASEIRAVDHLLDAGYRARGKKRQQHLPVERLPARQSHRQNAVVTRRLVVVPP